MVPPRTRSPSGPTAKTYLESWQKRESSGDCEYQSGTRRYLAMVGEGDRGENGTYEGCHFTTNLDPWAPGDVVVAWKTSAMKRVAPGDGPTHS